MSATVAPAVAEREATPRHNRFGAMLALMVAAMLITAQLLAWAGAIGVRGGLEGYARGIDFTAALTAGLIVHEGAGTRLYDLATQREAQERVLAPYLTLKADTILPYIHPPFEALLFAPLMELPYGLLYLAWTLGALLALAGSLWLLARAAPLAGPTRWVLPTAILSFSPLHQALWLGQSSPFVLLGLCGCYAGLRARREVWAGAALALVALKPQLLLVVGLLLLLQWHWRVLATTVAALVIAGTATLPILSATWPLRYLRFLADITRWDGSRNEYPQIMYDWRRAHPGDAARRAALRRVARPPLRGLVARARHGHDSRHRDRRALGFSLSDGCTGGAALVYP